LVPQFNVLWLDPINPDSFPAGLLDAVTATTTAAATTPPDWSGRKDEERSIILEEQLREQMRADALQPLDDDEDVGVDDDVVASSLPKNTDFDSESHLPPKWIEDAAQFLRLNVSTHVRGCCPLLPRPSRPLFEKISVPPLHCWLIDDFVTSPRNAWTAFCSICARNITTVSGVAHSTKVPTKCKKSARVLRRICTTRVEKNV
jgi:hypothetical protein